MKKAITLASASLLLVACSGEPSKGDIQDAFDSLIDTKFAGKGGINVEFTVNSLSGCGEPVEGKYECNYNSRSKVFAANGKLWGDETTDETDVFYKEDGDWKMVE